LRLFVAIVVRRFFAMASKSIARFTTDINGEPKTLFSVALGNRDDVFLILKSLNYYGKWEKAGPLAFKLVDDQKAVPSRIVEQRYSIHPSSESPLKINIVNQTIRLDPKSTVNTRANTKTIKSGDNFAPIFSRRSSGMTAKEYASKKSKAENISLGAYDPSKFTLVYMVIASHKDRVFVPLAIPFLNLVDRVFLDVRITVLWSFVSLPSLRDVFTLHYQTADSPEHRHLANGQSAEGCCNMFIIWMTEATAQMLQLVREGVGDIIADFHKETAAYFKSGLPNTPEWRSHLELVSAERAKSHARALANKR
jgi:hypothetical protein